ncbi:SRPBCC domain-containing protein [Nocardia sp. SYP-A9097]|uniref:SRPBCC family protein n=1 Tax=Nocardia sp. SYP-A9097 TaxID=2663237 RepID=UPI00129AD967|nr:SRPBCC domain-containing protein [Nocardia sp. SYP-A9097]MRH89659.1 SRPBCC domain-containing protein [Nocardia sp. SYP-A9097]
MSDDLTTIELDHYYPHPPEKVWRALTTPELMGQWMMQPIGFEPVAGNIFEMKTQPMPGQDFSGEIRGEVLEAIAPQRLRLTWDDANAEARTGWIITWELRPEGRGTRILFTHTGFDPDDATAQRTRGIMGKGWASMLDGLQRVLAAE